MRLSIFITLVTTVSAAQQLRSNTEEVARQRELSIVNIYRNKGAWQAALSEYEVSEEKFSDVVTNGATATTLSVGANDLGLFDVVLSSIEDASTVSSAGTFATVYEKGHMEVTLNNFEGGQAYGFGAYWDVEDAAGVNTDDFKILVDGASVDIGSFPSSRGMQYGIGFVGIVVTDGFKDIVFYADGAAHTHIEMKTITIGYMPATAPPTGAPTTPLPSGAPTTPLPSDIPTTTPTNSPTTSKPTPSPTTSMLPSMVPTTSASPSVSHAPSATASTTPSGIPTTSNLPTTTASTTPSDSPTTSKPSTASPVATTLSPTIGDTPVPSTSPPTSAPTLSLGSNFVNFWLDYLESGQVSEYISVISGWGQQIFLLWWNSY